MCMHSTIHTPPTTTHHIHVYIFECNAADNDGVYRSIKYIIYFDDYVE